MCWGQGKGWPAGRGRGKVRRKVDDFTGVKVIAIEAVSLHYGLDCGPEPGG